MNRILVWFSFFLISVSGALNAASREPSYPESRLHQKLGFSGKPLPEIWLNRRGEPPQVALYTGTGSWGTGKQHMKMFLQENGFSYRTLSAAELLGGELEKSQFQILMMPGGESWKYLEELGTEGARLIRNYVESGGSYFGVCAGAFYATSQRQGGPTTGAYGIGLLEGTAYDGTSLGTAPFKEGMLDFDTSSDELMRGLPAHFRSVLLGGPSFHYSEAEAQAKKIRVLMQFQKIREPAMILFHYGEGRVFLSGPHLEIEEDRTDWGPDYFDPDSEWPIMERVVHYLLGEASSSEGKTKFPR